MEELRELYQHVILDHNKNPKNFHEMDSPTHTAEGYNPLCGDRLMMFLRVEDNIIKDISFMGSGCAISKASASVMTAMLKGKSISEAERLFKIFQEMITSDPDREPDVDSLGKLTVFAGVREFPLRIKCAGLAWHTLSAAIGEGNGVVSTE